MALLAWSNVGHSMSLSTLNFSIHSNQLEQESHTLVLTNALEFLPLMVHKSIRLEDPCKPYKWIRVSIRWAQTYHVKYLLLWRCICDVYSGYIIMIFLSPDPIPKGPEGKALGTLNHFLVLGINTMKQSGNQCKWLPSMKTKNWH